ncbi:hypothetical protein K4K59_010903 [Colletotrichum sp. SAR11_240]|nr:hypothetical protein K4K59_010903 [Colletotrichum sp. SAR11_240]
MQFFNTIALASGLISAVNAVAAPAANPTKCNADNCLRDVRASAFPTRSGIADCQAFQTVTSSVVTTPTVTAAAAPKVKRAVVDPNIRITQVAKRASSPHPRTVNVASASKFDFVADSANPTLCRLRSVATNSAISVVADNNGEFDNSHYLRVSDPAAISAAGYKTSPVYCVKGAANKLQCTAVDSAVRLRGMQHIHLWSISARG